jgi:hypothetical protein
MKVRRMSEAELLAALSRVARHCPGSRYERDLNDRLATLRMGWRSYRGAVRPR